jgi:hypothetical protein
MAQQPKSSAERMRRLRDRKRCGTVIVQDIEVERSAIDLLVRHGWIGADVAHDPILVRTALVDLVNEILHEPDPQPERSPRPFRKALQAVKVFSFGLF